MKIFPENDYSIELNNDSSLAISELENQTLSKDQFFTNWNNQAFIGNIEKNEFEEHPDRAAAFIKDNEIKNTEEFNVDELAAFSIIASAIINLSESLQKN